MDCPGCGRCTGNSERRQTTNRLCGGCERNPVKRCENAAAIGAEAPGVHGACCDRAVGEDAADGEREGGSEEVAGTGSREQWRGGGGPCAAKSGRGGSLRSVWRGGGG